jgi:hypothetical protein
LKHRSDGHQCKGTIVNISPVDGRSRGRFDAFLQDTDNAEVNEIRMSSRGDSGMQLYKKMKGFLKLSDTLNNNEHTSLALM